MVPSFKPIGKVVAKFVNGPSGQAVTRHRYGPSSTVAFRRAAGEKTSTVGVRVWLPPIDARNDRRPEGVRRAGGITIYSLVEFRPADEKTGTRADELERADGTTYTIEAANNYFHEAGFYEAFGVLLNRGPA